MTVFQQALVFKHGLSLEEAQVAELVAQGLTRDRVCKRLGISRTVIQDRMTQAYKKLKFGWPKDQLRELFMSVSRVGGGVITGINPNDSEIAGPRE